MELTFDMYTAIPKNSVSSLNPRFMSPQINAA